jgi:Polysaccharide deacetylase
MTRSRSPVAAALAAAPAPITFFFRDDDAGWRDDRLRALLDLFDGVPLDLAVIPAALSGELAAELRTRTGVGLHQHGWSHENHEPEGRKHEFGPSRPRAAQRADIERGRERLAELLGDRLDPIFTPPWNRCTADTGHCLVELGFSVLSREARAEPLGLPGLAEIPVRVDWVKPERSQLLADAIPAGGPCGVMFHHAVMDDGDMRSVGELLELVAGHDRVRCVRMMELVANGLAG